MTDTSVHYSPNSTRRTNWCAHIYIYTYTHKYTYKYKHIYIYIYIYTHTHTHMYTTDASTHYSPYSTRTTHSCAHICRYVHAYKYTYQYQYMCMYLHMHTYTKQTRPRTTRRVQRATQTCVRSRRRTLSTQRSQCIACPQRGCATADSCTARAGKSGAGGGKHDSCCR